MVMNVQKVWDPKQTTTERPVRAGTIRISAVVAILSLVGSLWVSTSLAAPSNLQDGTAVRCSLPEASGLATAAEPATGSGAVSASPVADASGATGQPADEATVDTITLLVQTLAACSTDGNNPTVAALVSQRYLGSVYGGGGELSRGDFLQLAAQLPTIPVAVVSVADVRVDGPRDVNADVVTVVGNQLVHGRWSFVLRPVVNLSEETTAAPASPTAAATSPAERWLVNGLTPLAVNIPAAAAAIRVGMDEYSFDISPNESSSSTVVLYGVNKGKQDHEMLVLRLDRGVSSDVLVRNPGPGFPAGVTFIGQLTVAAGGKGSLVLVDLPPGYYSVVSLLPDSDGIPDLAQGMRARFRIMSE